MVEAYLEGESVRACRDSLLDSCIERRSISRRRYGTSLWYGRWAAGSIRNPVGLVVRLVLDHCNRNTRGVLDGFSFSSICPIGNQNSHWSTGVGSDHCPQADCCLPASSSPSTSSYLLVLSSKFRPFGSMFLRRDPPSTATRLLGLTSRLGRPMARGTDQKVPSLVRESVDGMTAHAFSHQPSRTTYNIDPIHER